MDGPQETEKVFVKDLSTVGMGCASNHLFQMGDMMLLVKSELIISTGEVAAESLTGRVGASPKNDPGECDAFNTVMNDTIGDEFRSIERVYPRDDAYVKELEKTYI